MLGAYNELSSSLNILNFENNKTNNKPSLHKFNEANNILRNILNTQLNLPNRMSDICHYLEISKLIELGCIILVIIFKLLNICC